MKDAERIRRDAEFKMKIMGLDMDAAMKDLKEEQESVEGLKREAWHAIAKLDERIGRDAIMRWLKDWPLSEMRKPI